MRNRPVPADDPTSESPYGEADAEPVEPSGSNHLSESIRMERWLRLLVVTATSLLLFLVVAVLVRLMSSIGHTLLIFSLGGLLAYALDPLVERVRGTAERRRARTQSVLVVFLGIFGIVALVSLLLSKSMVRQVDILAREHAIFEAHARARLAQTDTWLASRNVRLNLSGYLNHPPPNVKTWGELIASKTLTVLGSLSKDVVEAFLVVLIALYFLIYSEEMRERFNHALPLDFRRYVERWQDDVNSILGGFVRGQLVLALTIGAMAAVVCLLMGLRLWLLIGLFVVVASLIPVAGPFLGAIPAVVAALVSPHALFNPVVRVVILLICFGVINEVGSKILYPRLVGGALGLHEVLVLFVLLAGLEVGGLVGVLFAAPLTALALVTLTHLYRLWQGLPPISVAQAAQRGGRQAKARGTP